MVPRCHHHTAIEPTTAKSYEQHTFHPVAGYDGSLVDGQRSNAISTRLHTLSSGGETQPNELTGNTICLCLIAIRTCSLQYLKKIEIIFSPRAAFRARTVDLACHVNCPCKCAFAVVDRGKMHAAHHMQVLLRPSTCSSFTRLFHKRPFTNGSVEK